MSSLEKGSERISGDGDRGDGAAKCAPCFKPIVPDSLHAPIDEQDNDKNVKADADISPVLELVGKRAQSVHFISPIKASILEVLRILSHDRLMIFMSGFLTGCVFFTHALLASLAQ